jgi:hypothetical protein
MDGGATKLVKRLTAHLRRIDCTRVKAEALGRQNHFVRRDIELVYMGLFLEAVTSFEGFLEDMFVGLVCKSVKHPSRTIKPKAAFKSWVVCHEVLRGGRAYAEWMPYDHTLKRAGAYLAQGLPFTCLVKNDTDKLMKISMIRNAIAHKSRVADEKFQKHVIASANLLPREKTPAGYLRTVFASSPSQTRYEECICDIASIARNLVAKTQRRA